MASTAVSTFPQQVAKMLSRKSVAIPIAAGSIILFLQWRKRRSQSSWLKSSKPEESPESHKAHDKVNGEEAQSKEIETSTTADHATVPQARLWSSQEEELGTAYLNAKRPRLDTATQLATADEKPYVEVRTDSFLPVLEIVTPSATESSRRESRRESIQVDTTVQLTYEIAPWPGSAGMEPTFSTIVEAAAEAEPLSAASSIFSNPFKDETSAVPTPDTSFGDFNFGRRDTLTPGNDGRFARKNSIQVDTIVECTVETTEAEAKPWVETFVHAGNSSPSRHDDDEKENGELKPHSQQEEAFGRRQSIQVDTVVSRTVSPAPPSSDSIPRVESIVEADPGASVDADLDPLDPLAPSPLQQPPRLKVDTPLDTTVTVSPALSAARSSDADFDPLSPLPPSSTTSAHMQPPIDRLVHVYSDADAPLKHLPGMGVPNSARDALVMRVRKHSVADAVVDAEVDDARSREGLVAVVEGGAAPGPATEPVEVVVEREWLPGFGVPNA